MKGGAHGPELVKPGLLNAAKDAKGRGLVVRVPLTDPEPMEWVALAAAWTFVLVSAYLIFAGGLL